MFDGRWRAGVDRCLLPVGGALVRLKVRANHVTLFGVANSAVVAGLTAVGRLRLALVFLILTGLGDLLDGPVAKAAGTSNRKGAFLDSVSDRVSDSLILGGLAWYYLDSGIIAMLPVGLLASSQIISYQRAKAEAQGLEASGGLMERAERFVVLCFGFLFPSWMPIVLWVLLGLVLLTGVQRFVKIWRQL